MVNGIDNFPDIDTFIYLPRFLYGKNYIKFAKVDGIIKKIENIEILTIEDLAKHLGVNIETAKDENEFSFLHESTRSLKKLSDRRREFSPSDKR